MNKNYKVDKEKTIFKLHKQFALPTANHLMLLIKDQECRSLVDKISENHDIFKKCKAISRRPILCIPFIPVKHFPVLLRTTVDTLIFIYYFFLKIQFLLPNSVFLLNQKFSLVMIPVLFFSVYSQS